MSRGHYLLSAEASFSAAHTLPGVDTCDRMHGHDWRVRVTVRVEENGLDAGGMALDFRVIEEVTRDVVADFDHRLLNELDAFAGRAPTAERLARVISDRARQRLAGRAPRAAVAEVEVWETPQYRVVYRPG